MGKFEISTFSDEAELYEIMELMEKELSEPYSIYTFRYFIYEFPTLTIMAKRNGEIVGAIVGRVDTKKGRQRGYLAMIVVKQSQRNAGIGSKLVDAALKEFKKLNCDEVVLETEQSNKRALKLYERFGFIREKLLERYYMNSANAYRLKLFFNPKQDEYI